MKMMFFLFSYLILSTTEADAKRFSLSSPELKKNTYFQQKYLWNKNGCKGENISPPLEWEYAPKNTESFALTVFDPDATSGSGWWHWVLINIPKTAKKISENASKNKSIPHGSIEIRNDFGEISWGGPCPPPGETHHYVFTIYALKTKGISVNEQSTPAQIGIELQKNMIKKASFTIKASR